MVKNPPAVRGKHGLDPWDGKIPQSRAWQPTSVFLPGEFHRQRSLVGYSPRGHKESDTTEATEHARIGTLEVPETPTSLGSIHLLEWFSELRETFHLPAYHFAIKGCNSGTADARYAPDVAWGRKQASMPFLWAAPLPAHSHGRHTQKL